MAFIYPIFQSLIQSISRRIIYQKWGEAHSDHIKEHHQRALSDSDRRTLSPSIDAIFTLYDINQLDFFVIEVSGAPWANNQEHFLGDQKKIAKTLKLMMKNILTFNQAIRDGSCLKLYALQTYKNQWYVYSITTPTLNMYVFDIERTFKVPTVNALLHHSYDDFLDNLWILKKMIISSCKGVEDYLINPPRAGDGDTHTGTSSPYVSPKKQA